MEIRNKLSKLSNVNSKKMEFKSSLPSIESKINYSKQKIVKDLEELSYNLGIEYKYPI